MYVSLYKLNAIAMILENPSEVIIPYQAEQITALGLQG